jgi:hypothetical protein
MKFFGGKKMPETASPTPEALAECAALEKSISDAERSINILQQDLTYRESVIRPLKLARSVAKQARTIHFIDLALEDVVPPYEAKRAEMAKLREDHKALLNRRAELQSQFSTAR